MPAGAAAKAAPLDPEAPGAELVEDEEPPLDVVVGPEDPLTAWVEVVPVPVLVPETGAVVVVPVFVAEAALQ